jgi:hypothetical protein
MNSGTDWIGQARELFDMVTTGLVASAASAGSPGASSDAEGRHGDDCRWCPMCQAAAVVRGERPEVTAALADVLTAAAEKLRSLAEADRPPVARPATPPAAGAADPPPVVQRVNIA